MSRKSVLKYIHCCTVREAKNHIISMHHINVILEFTYTKQTLDDSWPEYISLTSRLNEMQGGGGGREKQMLLPLVNTMNAQTD